MSKKTKKYAIKIGSLPNQYYHKNKLPLFILFILVGIVITFNSLNATGFAVSNLTQATPGLSGLLFFIAGLTGIFLILGESSSLEGIAKEIDFIETAKGSTYNYLPNGRTQRYKKAEGKHYEPQDTLVFIPDYKTIQKIATKGLMETGVFGGNETEYHQEMLNYLHRGIITIINSNGKILKTKEQINAEKGNIFLAFQKTGKEREVDFTVPVSTSPRLGYYTFDTRKFKKGEEEMRERHIGNKVVKIGYKDGRVVS